MLPYDADHVITVDELREYVYDDDAADPIFADARYDAWIARYPDDWRMSALAAADRVLAQMASRPNRLASDGDSIGWSDARVTVLQRRYDELLADVNADDMFSTLTVSKSFLTGCPTEGDARWP